MQIILYFLRLTLFAGLVLVMVTSENLRAADPVPTTDWAETGDRNFANAANWTNGSPAGTSGLVGRISDGTWQIDSNFRFGSGSALVIDGNAVLTANTTFQPGFETGTENGVGTVVIGGNAVLNLNSGLQFSSSSSTSSGTSPGSVFTIKDNAVINIKGNAHWGRNNSSSIIQEGNAVVNFNGGGGCVIGEHCNGTTYSLKGGVFNLNAMPTTYEKSLQISGTNQLIISGGRMNLGSDTFKDASLRMMTSASCTLEGGTLNISGLLKNAGTFNFNGGTLSVNTVSRMLIQNGGVLAPGPNWDETGTVIGTTVIQADYTLNHGVIRIELKDDEAGNVQADLVTSTETITLMEDSTIELINDFDPHNLKNGQEIEIVTASDRILFPTEPSDFNRLLSGPGAYYFDLDVRRNALVLRVDSSAIPEPSTGLLLIFGAFALPVLGRNRRRLVGKD